MPRLFTFKIFNAESDEQVDSAVSLQQAFRTAEKRMRRSGRLDQVVVGPKTSYWPLGHSNSYSTFSGWEDEDGNRSEQGRLLQFSV